MNHPTVTMYIVTDPTTNLPYIAFDTEDDAKIWGEENGGNVSKKKLNHAEYEKLTWHKVTEEEFLDLTEELRG